MLVRRRNDKTGRLEWCLASVSSPGKILKWFGTSKPSEEKVSKEERRVQYFKHKGG